MAEEIILRYELNQDKLSKAKQDHCIICRLDIEPSERYRRDHSSVAADICLVDVQLPAFLNENENLEGIYLARELFNASSGRTHIIFMSRHEFPETGDLPFTYHFLKKPFHISELTDILEKWE